MIIRPFKKPEWKSVQTIIEPVFRSGETYAFSPDITEEEQYRVWIDLPKATYVAVDDNGDIIGTYYIKANQSGNGDHVCNCGYIVSENARGQGVAERMCRHSQNEALALGFHAMQFNLVVSTNEGAVRLWTRLGFDTIGALPESFRHPRFGYVDAFIMYKILKDE